MRTLAQPPSSVVSASGAIQFGSFRGSLPKVDLRPLGKNALYRLAHLKKWLYVAIAKDDLFLGLAIVDLGYAKNTFAFAYQRGATLPGRMLVDRAALGHPGSGSVSEGIARGFDAKFFAGKTKVEMRRPGDELEIDAMFYPDLEIRARVRTDVAHPALSAIGPIPGGVVNTTEKQALLPVTGEVVIAGERRSLDGGMAGWDYTHGYLARHTEWRWAYLMGRTVDGARVAMNLVQGFLGEVECGVWIDDELFPVGEGRFEFDKKDPLGPWRVKTTDGAVDLRFSPGGMHADRTDFKVIRSSFVQPVGVYSGTIEVSGRTFQLERVLGVVEDQDVLW